MNKHAIGVIFAICLVIPSISSASGFGSVLAELARQAGNAAGVETGKTAVEYFKNLFNKSPEIAKGKNSPQLQDGSDSSTERKWKISPAGSLTPNDIEELKKTLTQIDSGKKQAIEIAINSSQEINTDSTVIKDGNSPVVIGDGVYIGGNFIVSNQPNGNDSQKSAAQQEPAKTPQNHSGKKDGQGGQGATSEGPGQNLIKKEGQDVLIHEGLAEVIPGYDPKQSLYIAYGEPAGCGPEGNLWMQNPQRPDVSNYAMQKEGSYFRAKGMVNSQFQVVQITDKTGQPNVNWAQLQRKKYELGNNYSTTPDCNGNPRVAILVK